MTKNQIVKFDKFMRSAMRISVTDLQVQVDEALYEGMKMINHIITEEATEPGDVISCVITAANVGRYLEQRRMNDASLEDVEIKNDVKGLIDVGSQN